MAFNIEETLKAMAASFGKVLTDEWPSVKDCVEKVLQDEKAALEEIALARINSEINDEELQSQLDDEQETLKAALEACKIKAKAMLQQAINAALKAFEDAIKTLL